MNNERKLYYEDFGAVGDGVTDDYEAITRTHYEANHFGGTVCATSGKTYYIGASSIRKPIFIRSDVDFSDATIIIDDTVLPPYDWGKNRHVFTVLPDEDKMPYKLDAEVFSGISLKSGQRNIGFTLPEKSLLHIVNDNEKQYIRFGGNANSGLSKQEVILVDKDGTVDESTPIMWDYGEITEISVFSVNDKPLTVSGGKFITRCNKLCEEFPKDDGKVWYTGNQYYYYYRGLSVQRSNTVVRGVSHELSGEGEGGYPYSAWFDACRCNNVLFEDLRVSGHKVFIEDRGGVKGSGTPMGSYDLGASCANAITWRGCRQINCITDETLWGIMGSNYTKNLTYDNCYLSRFDAHEGVYNATIKNSTIGSYINAIGAGTLLVENTKKLVGRDIVSLRDDYGSTWHGDVIIRNCEFEAYERNWFGNCALDTRYPISTIFNGRWSEHNFGYTCYMPRRVIIENLKIKTDKLYIFNYRDFVPEAINSEINPFILPEEVSVTGVSGYDVELGWDDAERDINKTFLSLGKEGKIKFTVTKK